MVRGTMIVLLALINISRAEQTSIPPKVQSDALARTLNVLILQGQGAVNHTHGRACPSQWSRCEIRTTCRSTAQKSHSRCPLTALVVPLETARLLFPRARTDKVKPVLLLSLTLCLTR
jgi:hypothetical protein